MPIGSRHSKHHSGASFDGQQPRAERRCARYRRCVVRHIKEPAGPVGDCPAAECFELLGRKWVAFVVWALARVRCDSTRSPRRSLGSRTACSPHASTSSRQPRSWPGAWFRGPHRGWSTSSRTGVEGWCPSFGPWSHGPNAGARESTRAARRDVAEVRAPGLMPSPAGLWLPWRCQPSCLPQASSST